MYYWGTSNVECPYYIREARLSMTCEGFIGNEIMMRFADEKDKEAFQRQECCRYPNGCIICNANDKKHSGSS